MILVGCRINVYSRCARCRKKRVFRTLIIFFFCHGSLYSMMLPGHIFSNIPGVLKVVGIVLIWSPPFVSVSYFLKSYPSFWQLNLKTRFILRSVLPCYCFPFQELCMLHVCCCQFPWIYSGNQLSPALLYCEGMGLLKLNDCLC